MRQRASPPTERSSPPVAGVRTGPVVVFTFLSLVLFPFAGVADPSENEIRESAARVLANEGFQTEFPGEHDTDLRGSGGSRSLSSSRGWRSGSRSIDMRPIQSVAGIISLLFWVAIVAIFAILVGWVAREAVLMARRERIHQSAPDQLAYETERSARFSLDMAKNLAAEGDLAAAVRALLSATLAHLAVGGAVNLRTSTTGREALRQVQEPAEVRRNLAVLVVAVEYSCFGGISLNQSDFHRCCAAVDAILEPAEDHP